MRLRYAIAGCGAAGKVHAYHFSRDERVDCIAAADPSSTNADYFREHFGFCRTYESLEELLQHEEIDVVSIASPPAAHLDQLALALAAQVSVLCEKPLVVSHEEIQQLRNLIRRTDATVSVMLPRRSYNNTRAVRQALKAGALGTIRQATLNLRCRKSDDYYATWRGRKAIAGGGVLLSQTIHSIDQLVYFFGPPIAVDGHVRTVRAAVDVEDEAEGTILFETGVEAHIRASCNATDCEWRALTAIVGSKGRVHLDSARTVCWDVPGVPCPAPEAPEATPVEYKPTYYGPGHSEIVQDFLGAVEEGRPPLTPATAALPALALVFDFYRSAALGTSVSIENTRQVT